MYHTDRPHAEQVNLDLSSRKTTVISKANAHVNRHFSYWYIEPLIQDNWHTSCSYYSRNPHTLIPKTWVEMLLDSSAQLYVPSIRDVAVKSVARLPLKRDQAREPWSRCVCWWTWCRQTGQTGQWVDVAWRYLPTQPTYCTSLPLSVS